MESVVGVLFVIAIIASLAPIFHALRARDPLAGILVCALCGGSLIAFSTVPTIFGNIIAAVLWVGAYLGAVMFDNGRMTRDKLQEMKAAIDRLAATSIDPSQLSREQMIDTCPSCGATMNHGQKVCTYCGHGAAPSGKREPRLTG